MGSSTIAQQIVGRPDNMSSSEFSIEENRVYTIKKKNQPVLKPQQRPNEELDFEDTNRIFDSDTDGNFSKQKQIK